MSGPDICHFLFLTYAEHTLKMYTMLSVPYNFLPFAEHALAMSYRMLSERKQF